MTTPNPAPVTTSDAERAAFEAFMSLSRRGQGAKKAERLLNKFPDGTYVEESVQRHWWTWQQALAAQQGGEGLSEAVLDDLWYLAEQTGLGNMSSRLRAHEFAKLICRAARPALPIDFKQATDQGGWIGVDDRLPGEQGHDSEEVLCFLSGHCASTDFECRGGAGWGIRLGYYDAEKGMFRTGGRPDSSVTHWQPLPAAPTLQGVADGDAA